MNIIEKRPILVINGKIYRRWTGDIPRKTAKSPIPDGLSAITESQPDGPAIITVDTGLPVMKPGSRHMLRFWFRGDQISLSPSQSGRLIVCVTGQYRAIEPLTVID